MFEKKHFSIKDYELFGIDIVGGVCWCKDSKTYRGKKKKDPK